MSEAREYGLLAEFQSAERLLDAARRAREQGYRRIEAYSPFPIEGLAEAIGFTSTRVPLITLLGGIIGGAGTYFMQWYSAVIDYPINSGARPLHSWPAFIPATFELAVLGAALAAFFGFLIASGLPHLSHPVFNAKDFDLASRNRFFLCIRHEHNRQRDDDTRRARAFLSELDPLRIVSVPE